MSSGSFESIPMENYSQQPDNPNAPLIQAHSRWYDCIIRKYNEVQFVDIFHCYMRNYPPYYHDNRCKKWCTRIFSLVSLSFVISLNFALFFQQENVKETFQNVFVYVWNTVILFLYFFFAAIDRILCLMYFMPVNCWLYLGCTLVFDNSWYYQNKKINDKFINKIWWTTFRLLCFTLLWVICFIISFLFSYNWPTFRYFGWDMPFIVLLSLYHVLFHIPAILSQFAITAVILEYSCYLEKINEISSNLCEELIDINDKILKDFSTYSEKYEKMKQDCRLFSLRALIIICYTSADIWLLILCIYQPIYGTTFKEYVIYNPSHTIYSIIPFLEFMIVASKLTSLYNSTWNNIVILKEKPFIIKNDPAYKMFNNFTTNNKPMTFQLCGIQVSWTKTTISVLFFILEMVILNVIIFVSET